MTPLFSQKVFPRKTSFWNNSFFRVQTPLPEIEWLENVPKVPTCEITNELWKLLTVYGLVYVIYGITVPTFFLLNQEDIPCTSLRTLLALWKFFSFPFASAFVFLFLQNSLWPYLASEKKLLCMRLVALATLFTFSWATQSLLKVFCKVSGLKHV